MYVYTVFLLLKYIKKEERHAIRIMKGVKTEEIVKK